MPPRNVQPEILETLPEDSPAALHGRRDLRIVNRILGTHRWIIRTLRRHYQPGWRITELGAGDGALSLRLLRSGLCRPQDLHAFDLIARPPHWPAEAGWTQGDLFQHPLPDSEVLVVNLMLHHFQDDQLRLLGTRIPAATRLLIAAEPARAMLPSVLGRALCTVARFHPITRHDMQVSIRAGFRGNELPTALDLGSEWHIETQATPLGTYRLFAKRSDASSQLLPAIHNSL